MKLNRSLLTQFVARYPAQPATAFLRAIEIDVLAKAAIPDGLGLDLGCGDGILTDILFKQMGRVPHLVGIDPDPLETEAATQYAFYQRIHTCFGDAIPEADNSFDYVISNSVLEHIPVLEPVIAEAARLLKPGGQFFFTVPCPGFRENMRGSWLPWHSRNRYLESLDQRLAHLHYLSETDWRAMAKLHGLTVTAITGYLGRRSTRRWETLSRLTGGLLHSLSFGRMRPIEIQRRLNLRHFQNHASLPNWLASAISRFLAVGLAGEDRVDHPGCLLVTGTK